jgi:hypothetical protein
VNGSIRNMNVLDCDSNQRILVVKCMLHKKNKIGDLKLGYNTVILD